MSEFRWGIIGPGDIAHAFAKDLPYAKSAVHTIRAVMGSSKESTTQFAEEFKVPHQYYSVEEMLNAGGIDGVYIASPHVFHYEQALKCLSAGVPVLCEKPITINSRQLMHLMQIAEQKNVFLLEGMWIRFLPDIEKLLGLIGQKKIGEVHTMQADISYKAEYDPKSRYFNPELGGGSLLDLGIYPVFLSTLLFGRPEEILATGIRTETGVDGKVSAMFTYAQGKSAKVDSSFISNTEGVATIFGDNGYIRIHNPWYEKAEGITVHTDDGTKVFHKSEWEGKGLYFQVDEMVKCIQAGVIESSKYCHHFSLDVMRTLDDIRQQLRITYPNFE